MPETSPADDPTPQDPPPEGPTDPSKAPEEPAEPLEPDADDVRSAILMGVLFVGTIALAMLMAEALSGEVPPVFENPEDPTNPLIYLGLVIAFTAGILVVAKLGFERIIQAVILGAVFLTMVIIYQPLLGMVLPLPGVWTLGISLTLAGLLSALLYYYPEWYIVDAVGISVAAGATGWFGFSFGLVPALVLLVAFAAYDAIAVYRTKHMLDLADQVMGLRLPIMIVVPKVRGYSFLEGERLEDAADEDQAAEDPAGHQAAEDQADEDEPEAAADDQEAEGPGRDALFMGLGDIVIPGVLVVSAMTFLGGYTSAVEQIAGLSPAMFVALTTLAGATIGFAFLMRAVLKGKPHAGLPALNGGALIGFLVPVLWLYGTAPLIPQF